MFLRLICDERRLEGANLRAWRDLLEKEVDLISLGAPPPVKPTVVVVGDRVLDVCIHLSSAPHARTHARTHIYVVGEVDTKR